MRLAAALASISRSSAAVSLGALSALHVLWATGSAWPAGDRTSLADAVGGFREFPDASQCLAVAVLLGAASVSAAGFPSSPPGLARAGATGASLVLLARAVTGLSGNMPNAKRSKAFAALDRRVYSPVCLTLAALTAAGTLAR